MIETLHGYGVKSEYVYWAGIASIGLSITAWAVSRANKKHSKSQSDRWGIFIGHWAPTLITLGVALRLEEDLDKKKR